MIKQTFYYHTLRLVRRLFGVRLSYRQQYQDYLQSPRWKALSTLRKAYDGHRCTYTVGLWGRCTQTRTLQVHHTTYAHKGAPGIEGMAREFATLRTLCNKHHDYVHGYEEN